MRSLLKILKTWLEKCNNSKKLDFNPDVEIKAKLRYVKHYNPISIKKMKDDNKFEFTIETKVIDINHII